MVKLNRTLQKIFGSTGGGSEFAKIGSLAAGAPVYTKDLDTIQSLSQYLAGLFAITASGGEPPRTQDANSLYLLVTSQLKYIFQAGVPEYIATEDYYIGSICQVAGIEYVSQTGTDGSPNTGNDPTIDTTNWRIKSSMSLPIGSVIQFDGAWTDNVTMPGWYACIAANSGIGCPNLVDRFILGKAIDGSGALGGSNSHTISAAELPTHTHDVVLGAHDHIMRSYLDNAITAPSIYKYVRGGSVQSPADRTESTDLGTKTSTSIGSGTAIDTHPAYYSMIYIKRVY